MNVLMTLMTAILMQDASMKLETIHVYVTMDMKEMVPTAKVSTFQI